jgi:hypothetical protein
MRPKALREWSTGALQKRISQKRNLGWPVKRLKSELRRRDAVVAQFTAVMDEAERSHRAELARIMWERS